MKDNPTYIDLGFAGARLPAGTHICQIYSDEDERNDSLLRFLVRGLQDRERTACFTNNISDDLLEDYFSSNGISLQEAKQSGAFTMAMAKDVYFEGGVFDPERMLNLLARFYDDAKASNYPNARVIGEMVTDISHVSGGTRLLEYESRVSLMLIDHPVTAVCQYDARSFDGATIMDVLKVHPMMIVRGAVVHNPFYIPPEEFLRQSKEV